MTDRPTPPEAPTPEVDVELVRNVAALVEGGQRGMVLNLVADLRAADLAQIVSHLPLAEARALFGWIPAAQTADVLPELETALRGDLLDDLTAPEIARLLDRLETDDQADVLGDLAETDAETADAVLPQLEDAADVRQLLLYDEETAGGLMSTEYVGVPAGATVAQATEEVRRSAETIEPVYVVYAVGPGNRFEGVVSLKRLLLAPAETPLARLVEDDPVTVAPDVDQEEVARIMERYDLIALPVVDAGGRLLGRITIDDVVDVIREEAEEDLQRAVGITGEEEVSSGVLAISRGRLVWLLLGLVGAYVSGLVIVGFEDALQVAPVLALFIPIVMAMAGNAGIQSSAIAVQGLASGDIWQSDLLRRLGKELGVALVNGVVLAVALGLIVIASGFGDDTQRLALTAGLALLVVIVLSTLVGATVPLALSRVGVDPALAMGPFIMVSNDILGLAVFFATATVLYL